ncbi:MAG: DNA-binding transcriptional regulator [Phycisphaeraceae bacterium]
MLNQSLLDAGGAAESKPAVPKGRRSAPTRHVLLLVDSQSAHGRACIRGIARYARNHGGWIIQHRFPGQAPMLTPDAPSTRAWSGVIARIGTPQDVEIVRRLNRPTVDLMGAVRMKRVAVVEVDHRRIVELAVDHLVANGLAHLGFCGVAGLPFSDRREQCFNASHVSSDITLHTYKASTATLAPLEGAEQRWLHDRQQLLAWLKSLPKPVGIVACNDTRARHVLEACISAAIDVPGEVCVVGVDNDDVTCELCTPMLSSVDPNPEAVGFEAARVLDEMMQGRPPSAEPTLIPPLGVEKRASSEVQAFQHRDLNEAIRFIREHCSKNINVGSVVAEVGKSRATLQRRFRQHLGCTLHDYIQRQRMERVKRLLLETNYTAAQIARMLDFRTSTYLTLAFRKQVGMTPGQFRHRHNTRGRPAARCQIAACFL